MKFESWSSNWHIVFLVMPRRISEREILWLCHVSRCRDSSSRKWMFGPKTNILYNNERSKCEVFSWYRMGGGL